MLFKVSVRSLIDPTRDLTSVRPVRRSNRGAADGMIIC